MPDPNSCPFVMPLPDLRTASSQRNDFRRRAYVFPALLLTLILTGITACSEPPPPPEPLPPADHGEAPDPEVDPLGARLHARGLELVPRYEAEPHTSFRGHLRRGQVETHPAVLIGTRCYVAIALGSEGVEELDLTVVDASGAAMMRDDNTGPEAVVGLRHAICPQVPGSYRLQTRVVQGEGDYVVRLYGQAMF